LLSISVGLVLFTGLLYLVAKMRPSSIAKGGGLVYVSYRGGSGFLGRLFAKGGIYAVDMKGAEIEAPELFKNSEVIKRFGFPDEVEWSPDGKWIAFSTIGENAHAGGNSEIYLMRSDGTSAPISVTDNPESDLSPAWSPDGIYVAYHAYDKRGSGVYLLNVNCVLSSTTCNLSPLFLVKGDHPSWSPNGEQVVYEEAFPWNGGIFIINADSTGEPVRVSPTDQYCHRPQWSPRGDQIAFDCGGTIYVTNADGSNLTRLVDDADTPRWSPDGSQIAFVGGKLLDMDLGESVGFAGFDSPAPTSNALFIMNADGTNIRRLTSNDYQVISQFKWLPVAANQARP
jgi:TolB protein